ncbi:MAG: GNAT family N-acetyltransferase [Candidatus Binatia bacterium]|nr:GNAT family N-acetyltransferase [Candidatus Binatia bacterium]
MTPVLRSGKLAKVFVARHQGKLLAGGIFPFDQHTIYYLDGASAVEVQALRPNNLLHWEVIQWAAEHGIRIYDMVGAGIAGVARFKRTFGPKEVPYTYSWRALAPWARAARHTYAFLAPVGHALRYL